ncbi:hypothetical protein DRO53_04550 [Candidatus Bathyarchaeota archaeon]|nr:MAG: hypothetical protein DRO46_05075 [Candidatus Hecatellales archaeon]RLI34005.1 MAG: hypothetical protein DRO53_04550 [Candidatus Bathyarchaeota archaeon]
MNLQNFKIKLVMFLSAFLATVGFMPCRGAGCPGCGACLLIPFTAFLVSLRGKIVRRISLWRKRRLQP